MQQNDAELIHNFPNSHMSELQQSLSQLKMKVSLSSYQMLELTHHYQKFTDRLYQLNQKGIQLLNNSEYQSSLIYFQQAEKLLEYAASCGRTLQRHFIIAILHNQATAYQKLWDFQKAISYIEAIIFNLTSIIQNPDNRQLAKNLQIYGSPPQSMSVFQQQEKKGFIEDEYQNIKFLISKKFNLAKYYLQFSTLNSQNQNHQNALNYAKLAQKTLKQIFKHSYNYLLIVQRLQNNQGKQLLLNLIQITSQIHIKDYEKFLAEFTILKEIFDKKNIQTNSFAQLVQKYQKSKHQQSRIKQFSLGKIMELSPKSFDQKILQGEAVSKYFYIQECESFNNQLEKALYLAVSYFTISVQSSQLNRQAAKEIDPTDNKNASLFNSQTQQKLSEMFYILSLKISIKFVPELCHFTKYIYKNYCQNYFKNIKKSTQSLSKIDSLKQKYKFFLQESSDSLPSSKQPQPSQNQSEKQKKLINSKQKNSKLSNFLKQQTNIPKTIIPKLDVQLSQIESIQYGGSINFSKNLNKKFIELHNNKSEGLQLKKLQAPKIKQFRQMQAFSDISKKEEEIQQQKNQKTNKKPGKRKTKGKSPKNQLKKDKSTKTNLLKNIRSQQKQKEIKKISSNKSISPNKRGSKSQKKIKKGEGAKKQEIINVYNSKQEMPNKQRIVQNDKNVKMNKVKGSKRQFQSMGLDPTLKSISSNNSFKLRLLRSNQLLNNKSIERSQRKGIYFKQQNSNQKVDSKQVFKKKKMSKESHNSKSIKKISSNKDLQPTMKKIAKNSKNK